jgi:hypothetical protein
MNARAANDVEHMNAEEAAWVNMSYVGRLNWWVNKHIWKSAVVAEKAVETPAAIAEAPAEAPAAIADVPVETPAAIAETPVEEPAAITEAPKSVAKPVAKPIVPAVVANKNGKKHWNKPRTVEIRS